MLKDIKLKLLLYRLFKICLKHNYGIVKNIDITINYKNLLTSTYNNRKFNLYYCTICEKFVLKEIKSVGVGSIIKTIIVLFIQNLPKFN